MTVIFQNLTSRYFPHVQISIQIKAEELGISNGNTETEIE